MSIFKDELVNGIRLFLVLFVTVTSAAYDYYYEQEPLLLSWYLKAGNITQAQQLSQTNVGGRTSYTGYYTTDQNCGNNLFFWFVPAQNDWNSAPVLLWLNGGPGSTSLFGLFTEVGPWNHLKTSGFVNNNYTWTTDHNVLFVDQPVGTGFSFTEKDCYATNISETTNNMYTALVQFFIMFPNLQKNTFFITGESFTGHYGLELAIKIHTENQVASNLKINLIGVLIGNAVLDLGCKDASDLMYELGIVDEEQRTELKETQKQVIQAIEAKNYSKAIDLYNHRFYAGLPSEYNVLYDGNIKRVFYDYTLFVKDIRNRDSLHVGYTPFYDSNDLVNSLLQEEIAKTQIPNIEFLLQTGQYIVGFYTGQLDTIVSVSSVTCTLRGLQWSGSSQYLNATHSPWRVSGRLAGWTKTVGNLLEIAVRDAGHYAPHDQQEATLDMLKTVVSSKPGNLTPFGQ
uniref:Carboxypeptidase n=1 Tax=Graphocephala atropunctata TaxID=36148 RepID=A0A1B6M2Q1_9HEMI